MLLLTHTCCNISDARLQYTNYGVDIYIFQSHLLLILNLQTTCICLHCEHSQSSHILCVLTLECPQGEHFQM